MPQDRQYHSRTDHWTEMHKDDLAAKILWEMASRGGMIGRDV